MASSAKRVRSEGQGAVEKRARASDGVALRGISSYAGESKETDARRLEQRQKQIDYGKNTVGYERYCRLVPKKKRRRELIETEHPVTPDIQRGVSKRTFDAWIRRWRTQLHRWDGENDGVACEAGGADAAASALADRTDGGAPASASSADDRRPAGAGLTGGDVSFDDLLFGDDDDDDLVGGEMVGAKGADSPSPPEPRKSWADMCEEENEDEPPPLEAAPAPSSLRARLDKFKGSSWADQCEEEAEAEAWGAAQATPAAAPASAGGGGLRSRLNAYKSAATAAVASIFGDFDDGGLVG